MSGHTVVIAHHPYEPQREDELELAKGDKVTVTDNSDPDWWVGQKEDGTSGYFPSNFVEPAPSEEKEPEIEETGQEHVVEAPPPKPIGMARVMEDYAMQGPDELTLHRGGIVTIYERYNDGWLKGEINGKVGRFPAEDILQYVEDIDMPGRPDLGMQSVEPPKSKPEDGNENTGPSKPAFKLAAYGVKQGGIGSVLAGGFPTLKKTGSANKKTDEEPPKSDPPSEPPQTSEKQPEAQKVEPAEEKTKESPEPTKYIAKAIVLHPYDAENEDELSLLRGEYVKIIDKNVDEGWWKGTTERGQTGVFPSNFVKEVEEETIALPPPVRSRKSITSTGSQQSLSSTSASRVSTGISQRAPPLPDKSSRPTSTATSSRPGSVHDQAPIPTNEVPPPVPEIPLPSRTSSNVSERAPPLPENRPPVPPASSRPVSLHDKEQAADVPPPVPETPATTVETSTPKNEEMQSPAASSEKESALSATTFADEKPDETVASPPSTVSPSAIPSRPPMPSSRPLSDSANLASPPPVPGRPPMTPPRNSTESAGLASPPAVPGRPPSIPSRRSSESVDVASPPAATAAPPTEPIAEVSEADKSPESVPAEKPFEEEKNTEEPTTKTPTSEEKKHEKEKEKVSEEEPALAKEEATAVGPMENLSQPEQPSGEGVTKAEPEEAEPEVKRKELEMQPSGPRLSAPSRARPTRPRRAPESRKEEPSQMEMLQQQLDQTPPEEPKKEETAPPAKPVKPIFAKFPTPFAGGAPPELKNLKPVQRRMWEPAPAHEQETKKDDAEEPPRPTGVRNIASRFNVPSSGGSNEVLETKLKNFTKNEVEKSRKELERQLQEEREKRIQLEELVASLAEKVEELQSRLEQ